MDGAANAEEGACTEMDGAANVWEVLEATILVSATLVVRIPMLVFWEAALPLLGGFLVAFFGGGVLKLIVFLLLQRLPHDDAGP